MIAWSDHVVTVLLNIRSPGQGPDTIQYLQFRTISTKYLHCTVPSGNQAVIEFELRILKGGSQGPDRQNIYEGSQDQ